MTETLPLFPLGTVLYPGLLLPLHIFEDRYRQLVHELLGGPGPQHFGVIAIREGRETGVDSISSVFDLVTVGTQRFRLGQLDESRPYLQGEVEMLGEDTGDPATADLAARAVQRAFRGYLDALAQRGASQPTLPDLPDEPVALSYFVAATMIVDLPDKQALLAEPDALRRLTAEHTLLTRETSMLHSLTSAPAPDLWHSPYNPN